MAVVENRVWFVVIQLKKLNWDKGELTFVLDVKQNTQIKGQPNLVRLATKSSNQETITSLKLSSCFTLEPSVSN